ncbi:MAG: hypothetical protein KC653_00330 [Candidatus Andersenbacteria bacterium]|nr:hypothetical protein [Candidatus Andersenbacteria bacterium]
MTNKHIVVRPPKASMEVVDVPEFKVDLGKVKNGSTTEFTVDVLKPVAQGTIPTGCWCTAAKQRGNFIDFAIVAGGSGDSLKTVSYKYEDGTKFKVIISYGVA